MILVAGEALMDLVQSKEITTNINAFPGGAGFNVACALGNLGAAVSFAYPISNDKMGGVLLAQLTKHGVHYALNSRAILPTPLALVSITGEGQADYRFYRQGTADSGLSNYNPQDMLTSEVTALHLTGFTLNDKENFDFWYRLAVNAKKNGCMVSLDPNVRPVLITNPTEYRERIWHLIDLADVVKVSDEDLSYLAPDKTLDESSAVIANSSTLAVITLGESGCNVLHHGVTTHVDAAPVDNFVDTIGAGDCFSAGYLLKMAELGLFNAGSLRGISKMQIKSIFSFAALNASINCSRKGCQPPAIEELIAQTD